MDVRGKTALITGGGTGIGRAIALKLAQNGANIAVNYSRSEADAQETVRQVTALGVHADLFQANVSNNDEVVRMCERVTDRFGRIDILINNAGTTHFVALDDLDGMLEEYWDQIFAVNVKGMFFVSRACAEQLKKNKGCIINITSIAGLNGMGSSIAYAASKAAGISITKSLARVLAPDVRVNSVAPGIVLTRWVEGREDHVQRYGGDTPLGRVARPEDVADLVYGLILGGDFVTGQTVVVDGGVTM
jgi:3-oxoacyl-[acyl-carrier protein] reductase